MGTWDLVDVGDVPVGGVVVAFSHDGHLRFDGVCSHHSSTWQLDDEALVIGRWASTAIGCDPSRERLHDLLTARLGGHLATSRIDGDPNTLHLVGEGGSLSFRRPAVVPDTASELPVVEVSGSWDAARGALVRIAIFGLEPGSERRISLSLAPPDGCSDLPIGTGTTDRAGNGFVEVRVPSVTGYRGDDTSPCPGLTVQLIEPGEHPVVVSVDEEGSATTHRLVARGVLEITPTVLGIGYPVDVSEDVCGPTRIDFDGKQWQAPAGTTFAGSPTSSSGRAAGTFVLVAPEVGTFTASDGRRATFEVTDTPASC